MQRRNVGGKKKKKICKRRHIDWRQIHMEILLIMSNLRVFYPNAHYLFRNYYFCALDYLFVSDSSILRMEEKISYNFIEVYVL